MIRPSLLLVTASVALSAHALVSLNSTDFLFAFGDSYTTDGYNISAGIDSPNPGDTASNGQNWIEFLTGTYNVTNTALFNLAYGGATIDSALVTPYLPTVLSIVDQVAQFNEYLASKPKGAEWDSNNSLFAFWIGINDVGNSYYWTNVSQSALHTTLMDRLFGQVEDLYSSGARSFLFLTVPPTNRAPLILEQGDYAIQTISSALDDYNNQLSSRIAAFNSNHTDASAALFDTRPIFNTLLDNADIFGFVNVTGYCEAYENGTPETATEEPPCAPVSSYFWLNSLHPLFTVHNILAHALSTFLSVRG